MKLFQFAVFFSPNADSKKAGKPAKIVVDLTTILAENEREVTLKCAKLIPDDYSDKLGELEVAIRPF